MENGEAGLDARLFDEGARLTTLDAEAVKQAASRIEGLVERTPVISNPEIDQLLGCKVFFKSDHLQPGGAFKVRGATNMVFAQSASSLKAGVCTHSSGNHGAALARAAEHRGCSAMIVMPIDASAVKRQKVIDFGGILIDCEKGQLAREAALREVQQSTGALFVPPFDHPLIIAGQGTAFLELKTQVPSLDALVVPVGGGGLLAGSCLIRESTKIFGAEPKGADDAHRSFNSGVRVQEQTPETICDGLQTTLGKLNFEIIIEHATDILLASETMILTAMQLIRQATGHWVEPSSAVALAVVMMHQELFEGQRVGVILTGGNIDVPVLRSHFVPEASQTSG